MLAFGPEGYLYIGVGDGGGGNDPSNNAQNLEVLLGKRPVVGR
jgi:glucose/arabinose dehydrogenase